MDQLRVVPYSIDNLKDAILASFDPPHATAECVSTKNHLGYFETYFGSAENRAETIVIEKGYTDRDFLEDYAAYYVRCLDKYKSRCCRLHFFSIKFSQEDFDSLLRGVPTNDLAEEQFLDRNNYLGFVVIRPLPETFIGRTCLKTYPADHGRRRYPVTRDYEAHLAGFTLRVRSLAFQEQDRATSACATSALWSTFHGTGILFHHSIYSPVEITRHAVKRIPGTGRSFPNNGLTLWQMASAITQIGLEPETLDVSNQDSLQAVSYAYLRGGIPFLLVVSLYDASNPDEVIDFDQTEPAAQHAVAVTGFSLGGPNAVPHPKYGTLFRHTRINKLYVHDDQVGPFARTALSGPLRRSGPNGQTIVANASLETSWPDRNGNRGNVRFAPESAVIPLYHKIRISHIPVLANVIALDNLVFEDLRALHPDLLPSRLEWDVYLTTGWKVKESLRRCPRLTAEDRYVAVQETYPRFVWRAMARCEDQPVVDFLYDATDIETGSYHLATIWYNELVKSMFDRRA